MLHDETRKLLIEAWNKTHNTKEIAECFSVNTSTVYRLEKQMRETGSVKTMTSQRGRKHALTPEDCDLFQSIYFIPHTLDLLPSPYLQTLFSNP